MDANQITKVCLNDPFIQPYFFGTISRDEFPKNPPPIGLFIMNLDVRSKPGSHWVQFNLGLEYPGRCMYVDTFGRRPPKEIVEILLSRGWEIIYNDVVIQNVLSQSCGKIALLFLKLWSHGYSTLEIVTKFMFDDETSRQPFKGKISSIKRGRIIPGVNIR